jgi:alkylhydroperoxidase/carboxymuconolactone decarboxylase family protein YurZ
VILHCLVEKNLRVFMALRGLAEQEGMGSPSLILARTITESEADLQYMRANGFPEMIERFWRFNYAAAKGDLDSVRAGEDEPLVPELQELESKIDQVVQQYRGDFYRKKDELWHSWAKEMTYEKKMQWLVEHGEQDPEIARGRLLFYTVASRNTHVSPSSILHYMADDDRFREHDAWEREMALQFGITALAGIAILVAQQRSDQHLEDRIDVALEPLVPRTTSSG